MLNVKTNFQTYGTGFQLRFRMYSAGEVRYISVNNILQGNLLSKHWNQKKQHFIPSAPFSAENNDTLVKFKKKYDDALREWDGTLFSFNLSAKRDGVDNVQKDGERLSWVLDWCIENAKKKKHADGTMCGTFEVYEKVKKRVQEYCSARHLRYESIKMSDVDATVVNDFISWITKTGRGQYISSMFRSALNKADQQGWFDFETVEKCNWIKRVRSTKKKYETLTDEQCNKFVHMTLSELPGGSKRLLYHDFCVFTLYTCQSPCDAISLKKSDIKKINGVDHFVFKRRKIESKQSIDCTVPINPIMQKIIDHWSKYAEDGYIFPIRSKRKLATQKINNWDIKNFVKKCNVWLKKIGNILKCDFPLHNYTFRHTAITHYISKGIPVVYVANLAGTSVENCQNIYYNNHGDTASRDKVLAAIDF